MSMDKAATTLAYTASGSTSGYWLLKLLNNFTPDQWTAIGVLGGLFFAFLTYLTNLYFKIKASRNVDAE